MIPRVAAMLVAADNDGKSLIAGGAEGSAATVRDGDADRGTAIRAGDCCIAATVVALARGGEVLVAAVGASPVLAAARGCEVTMLSISARSRSAAAQSVCLLVTVRWPSIVL